MAANNTTPAALSHLAYPLFVVAGTGEMIIVDFGPRAGRAERLGNVVRAEAAINKEHGLRRWTIAAVIDAARHAASCSQRKAAST